MRRRNDYCLECTAGEARPFARIRRVGPRHDAKWRKWRAEKISFHFVEVGECPRRPRRARAKPAGRSGEAGHRRAAVFAARQADGRLHDLGRSGGSGEAGDAPPLFAAELRTRGLDRGRAGACIGESLTGQFPQVKNIRRTRRLIGCGLVRRRQVDVIHAGVEEESTRCGLHYSLPRRRMMGAIETRGMTIRDRSDDKDHREHSEAALHHAAFAPSEVMPAIVAQPSP